MITHSLPIDYRASIARGFVPGVGCAPGGNYDIRSSSPFTNRVGQAWNAALHTRAVYLFRNRQFRECIAHVSFDYASIKRPSSLAAPWFLRDVAWPPPSRATSRYLPSRGQVGMRVYERARYYRPNTGHREPSLLASTRARLSLVFTGSGLRWVCPGERKGLVSLFFEISRRGRVGTGWTACLFDSSEILFLIREEVIVFLRMFRREGIGSLYVTFFSSRKK